MKSINRVVPAAAFVFPIVVASVPHGGSTVFTLLFLMSLFLAWPSWRYLSKEEKYVAYGLILFFITALLSLVNTEDYAMAWRKLERYIRLLATVPIFMLIRRADRDVSQALILGVVVGCFVLAAQGFYQINIAGHTEASGAYHKIVFGDTAVLLAAFAFVAILTLAKLPWQVVVLSLAVLAGLYASVVSFTRSSWLLLPVLTVVLLWLYRDRLGRRGWISIGVAALLIVSIGSIWQPETIKRGIQQGISDLEAYQKDPSVFTSWGARLNLWRDSWRLFKTAPIVGIGIGDFDVERDRLVEAGESVELPVKGHAHNQYIHTAVVSGVVGLFGLLVGIFLLPLRYFFLAFRAGQTAEQRFVSLAGMVTVIAFAVFSIAEAWIARNPFVNLYCVFIALFLGGVALSGNTIAGRRE